MDTTTLGSDLLPLVDNVNTFADTMFVDATQKDYLDTTLVFNSDNHVLGNISMDPMFGTTSSSIYFQLKPVSFPFAFGNKDSLTGPLAGFDSVVLCLSYRGLYGDSNQVQQLEVFEISDLQFKDSTYDTRYEPATSVQSIGSKLVEIPKLKDYSRYTYIKDSVKNQVRIKLDPAYAARIFSADSTLSGSGSHAFYNDSLFRREFKGLAVKPVSGIGNALLYINLSDTNTKLEVHYRIRKSGGIIDTTYKSFVLKINSTVTSTTTTERSATANNIKRNRAGSASTNPTADVIYLQTQPGTFASLKIPQLSGYTNRIIHRAELIIEQIPDDPMLDTIFPTPNYLYLDLKDSVSALQYKPIYTDLNPAAFYDPDNKLAYFFPLQSGADLGYFGGFARRKISSLGGTNIFYNINVSRYIQRLVKNQGANYEFRLFPAYNIHYGQYSAYVPYNNSIAFGRMKIGTGTNPNFKMRLRIIYSPVK